MRISTTALAAMLLVSATAAQAGPNLLTNGSFETGDFSGWSQFGDTSYTGVAAGNFIVAPSDGNFQAVFGSVNYFGGITQSVGTAGNSYVVSFDLANRDGYGAFVNFGGVNLLTNPGNQGYVHYSFNVTALDNTGLTFGFFNPPSYYNLDNVSVQSGAVPEPASWALMLGGFGVVGGALRSRRKQAVSFG